MTNPAIKRKALLALPHRKWDEESVYDFLWLVPTGKKHDSGYGLIAIVGHRWRGDEEPFREIAAVCDDVCWTMPKRHPYGQGNFGDRRDNNVSILRMDCEYPSGIIRAWASGEHYFRGKFKVGASLSSTDVTLFVEPTGEPRGKATVPWTLAEMENT